MNTMIFDIDGTLVESMDFDTRLYIQAIKDIFGAVQVHDDWDRYFHVTDAGILNQIMQENGIDGNLGLHRLVKERFFDLVTNYLYSTSCVPIDGAIEIINELRRSGKWQIGLATGGWKCTAMAKLQSAGIDVIDLPLSSSDDAEDRQQIMRSCLGMINASSTKPVYVGDGPWDFRAANALGWGFVAIGSRLQGRHKPWIRDYRDSNWVKAPNQAIQADAFGAADF